MVMRLMLGLLLALALLAGCGDDTDTGAGTPATPDTATSDTAAPPDGPVDFTQVALVSASDAGGEVSPAATVLADDAAVADFAGQFEGSMMLEELEGAVAEAEVPEGEVLVAAVVAIGCTPPTEVSVEASGGELVVTAPPTKEPTVQCFAPVTTVALLSVDDALV